MARFLSRFTLSLFQLLVCLSLLSCDAYEVPDERSIAHGSRAEQIAFWEGEIRNFRSNSLSKAFGKLYEAQRALDSARRREGWIYTSEEDKARIKILDEEYRRNVEEVAVLQRQEQMMVARVKPLYGIVSRYFAAEQRDAIVSAVKTVQTMSYDNAFYGSLFNMDQSETITDLIVGFLVRWMMGYVFMYPFAALYYAFWKAPWSIYAFSSGTSDVFLGVAAWCVSVTLMCLPMVALIVSFIYIRRHYGDRIEEALRTSRARERRNR